MSAAISGGGGGASCSRMSLRSCGLLATIESHAPPHPDPLPNGERERAEFAASWCLNRTRRDDLNEAEPLAPPLPGGERSARLARRVRGSRAIESHAPPHPEQPGTWVTVLTGDMGNTFPVLFRSVAVVPVDPVGNAQRCPQVHRRHDVWVCAGGPRNGR